MKAGAQVLFGSLIIDFLLIGFGSLMRFIAIEPNHVFGYHSPRSRRSNEAWDYANQRGGSLLVVVGLIGLALTAFTEVFRIFTPFTAAEEFALLAAFLSLGVPLIGACIAIFIVERGLRIHVGKARTGRGVDGALGRRDRHGTSFVLRREERVTFLGLCLLPILIVVLGFPLLPETIVVYFDGVRPNGWVPKAELFMFAAIIALCNGGIAAAYRVFLKQDTYPPAGKSRVFACFAFAFLMLANSTVILAVILHNLGP